MTVDIAVIQEWLTERLADMRCAVCGERSWEVPPGNALEVRLDSSPTEQQGLTHPVHPYVPAVWVSCGNCGNILLFTQAAVRSWWRRTLERRSREEGWEED